MSTRQPDFLSDPAPVLKKCDSFDLAAERIAISVIKLTGWIAVVGAAAYGLWKSL